MTPTAPGQEDPGPRWLPALLVPVSLLPDLRAAIPTLTYYFRDFSLTYLPLRAFFAREVREGRFPFWNPYVHQGCAFLPVFYPPELLHALWAGPAAVSWLLTLHFPLAALAAYALARELGADRWGAFVAGSTYAMGGLSLSSLNLHWFLQALALAPLLALTLIRAALRGGRAIPCAGLALAVSVSTLAVEFVAQGLLAGVVLGLVAAPRPRAALRLALAVALGIGLAALPVALVLGILGESVRGAGFSPQVALRNAVPAVALLQVVIPDLYGSVAKPLTDWWGGRLFDQGSPYFMSLYLGPLALACAAAGAGALDRRRRLALLALAGLGLWYALGRPAGLAPLLAPLLPWFRYPCKALLLPHLACAVLAGLGLTRLRRGEGWGRFGVAAGAVIVPVAVVALSILLFEPGLARWLDISPRAEAVMRRTLLEESAVALTLAVAGLGVAAAAWRAKIPTPRAAGLLGVLLIVGLWRAGVGLNPQVTPAFFEPLPGMARERLDALDGGRVFSYGVESSPAFRGFLAAHGPQLDLWSFFLDRQMLDPYTNILDRVESAGAKDRLSFIGTGPELVREDFDPRRVGAVLARLRDEAVARVLSLDPLDHPELRLRAAVPAGPPGLSIRVYELLHPWPRAYLACRAVEARSQAEALHRPFEESFDPTRDVALEEPCAPNCTRGGVTRRTAVPGTESYEVESDGDGYLVTRDSYARGCRATIDGRPARVLRANGRSRAVPVPGGRHTVALRYDPPGLRAGLVVTVLAVAAALLLLARPLFGEAQGGPR